MNLSHTIDTPKAISTRPTGSNARKNSVDPTWLTASDQSGSGSVQNVAGQGLSMDES